jgi:hypothetical protein
MLVIDDEHDLLSDGRSFPRVGRPHQILVIDTPRVVITSAPAADYRVCTPAASAAGSAMEASGLPFCVENK